jgi:hypothetical protein
LGSVAVCCLFAKHTQPLSVPVRVDGSSACPVAFAECHDNAGASSDGGGLAIGGGECGKFVFVGRPPPAVRSVRDRALLEV